MRLLDLLVKNCFGRSKMVGTRWLLEYFNFWKAKLNSDSVRLVEYAIESNRAD